MVSGATENSSTSAGSRNRWMPMPTSAVPAPMPLPKISATQISPERSGSSSMPDIQNANIDRARHGAAHPDLDTAEVRRVAPHLRLLLADAEAVLERLLADGAAERPGEAAGLDHRHAQRLGMQVGAPQGLVRRDRQSQLAVAHLRTSRPTRRASSSAAGSTGTRRRGPGCPR